LIYIERTIEISNNEAKIYDDGNKVYNNGSRVEQPVVLYKGDKNIEIQFAIKNNPFKYKAGMDVTYGQLVIKRQSTTPIFSEVAKVSNGKILFIVTGDMIDELSELGNYDFQIRLINADKTSRGTLPPVTAGIIIKAPMCEEEQDSVNYTVVNKAKATTSEPLNVFDNKGDYIKTEWKDGDLITDAKLNKIEDALYEINAKEVHVEVDLSGLATEDYVNDAIAEAHANADFDLSEYITDDELNEILRTKADYNHAHDDAYYRKWQVDAKIAGLGINGYATLEDLTNWSTQFALKNHNHDERYVTNSNFDSAIGDINTILDSINGEEI
jgi:hypothetical protein